jgi:predicted DNA-binding transcriptional regulator AlpA
MPDDRDEVSLTELAHLLGLKKRTLAKLRMPRPPEFPQPSRRVGRTDLFRWADVRKFLDEWRPGWRERFKA